MHKDKSILCVIPAKGRSTGVPSKNIRSFAGRNLLHYAITLSKSCSYFDRTILMTDNQLAKNQAVSLGLTDIYNEPKKMCSGRIEDAMVDLLSHVEKNDQKYDFVYLLQCTAPLVTPHDVRLAIMTIVERDAPMLVSVCEAKAPFGICKPIKDDNIKGFLPKSKRGANRQEFEQLWQLNAQIYIGKWHIWAERKDYYEGEVIPFRMPKERSVDIDDMTDFKIAEFLMQRDWTYDR